MRSCSFYHCALLSEISEVKVFCISVNVKLVVDHVCFSLCF